MNFYNLDRSLGYSSITAQDLCCATGKSLGSCGVSCYRYGRRKLGAVGTDIWGLDWVMLRYP